MRANRKQQNSRSMMTSLFTTSLKKSIHRSITMTLGTAVGSVLAFGISGVCVAQSAKKITSDPYYSALRQSESEPESKPASTPASAAAGQSFYQSNWEPPKTAVETNRVSNAKTKRSNQAADVWSSMARKTTKPVTRIDFSRLNVEPKKTADSTIAAADRADRADRTHPPSGDVSRSLLSPLSTQPLKPVAAAGEAIAKAAKAASDFNAKAMKQALTPIKAIADAATDRQSKQTRSIIRQKQSTPTPLADAITNSPAKATSNDASMVKAKTIATARPLTPWKDPSEFSMPKSGSPISLVQAIEDTEASEATAATTMAAKIPTDIDDASAVKLSAYEPQLGENLKKIGSKIKSLASSDRLPAAAEPVQSNVRIADATHNAFTLGDTYTTPATGSHSRNDVGSGPVAEGVYQGESFENSRVLALVGGHPVFVGDMIFEINQIFEKYMKGAPPEAKEAQKGKLMARLLPKYVDSKMLYVSTLNQLPEGADIDDILKQAEKTFNEKALPDMMEKSKVDSPAKFDAILRSQGSSVRQMRRSWAKDQIAKFFLQEKVTFNRKVTHLEMLDEYRANYDDYAVQGKVRWEQIEIQPAKAGGRFAAKDAAEDIYQRLVHGGNFEAIAKKESHGFRAFKGGQYDWTSRGSLVNKEIDALIFTLPPGKLSGVTETKVGFHIIRVIERVEPHHTPFTEAQADIKKRLIDQRRDVAFESYIEGLKQQIKVEYMPQ